VSSHGEASVPNFAPKIKESRNLNITGQSMAMGSVSKSHDLNMKPTENSKSNALSSQIVSPTENEIKKLEHLIEIKNTAPHTIFKNLI
jgi:hypothetical protein